MTQFRVMTYNVHRCAGLYGSDSIADITSVCRDANADLIALQELDEPDGDEHEGAHHARDLAASLGMHLLFCRTFRRSVGYYGHALLCRHKLELQKATTFASSHLATEPRGAIWARATLPTGDTIDIISTHLGVRRKERAMQSLELVGHEWLASAGLKGPFLLCGDFNAIPYSATYRRFAAKLRDAQRALPGHCPRATFPSLLPVLRLDHVFVSPELDVCTVHVPWNARSRRASDHLPLIIELELGQKDQQR